MSTTEQAPVVEAEKNDIADALNAIYNEAGVGSEPPSSSTDSEIAEVWARNANRTIAWGEYKGPVSKAANLCIFLAGIREPEVLQATFDEYAVEPESETEKDDEEDPFLQSEEPKPKKSESKKPDEMKTEKTEDKKTTKIKSKSETEKKQTLPDKKDTIPTSSPMKANSIAADQKTETTAKAVTKNKPATTVPREAQVVKIAEPATPENSKETSVSQPKPVAKTPEAATLKNTFVESSPKEVKKPATPLAKLLETSPPAAKPAWEHESKESKSQAVTRKPVEKKPIKSPIPAVTRIERVSVPAPAGLEQAEPPSAKIPMPDKQPDFILLEKNFEQIASLPSREKAKDHELGFDEQEGETLLQLETEDHEHHEIQLNEKLPIPLEKPDTTETQLTEIAVPLEVELNSLGEQGRKRAEVLFEFIVETVDRVAAEESASAKSTDSVAEQTILQREEIGELCVELLQLLKLDDRPDAKVLLRKILYEEVELLRAELGIEDIADAQGLDEGTHERKRGMIARITQKIRDFMRAQLHKLLGKSALRPLLVM